MKKRHQTTLELYAKTVRMRTSEKRALRERLVAYMEYHPARVSLREVDAPVVESPLSSLSYEPFSIFSFSSWQFRASAGAFAFMLLVGVPLFAERAVPGDALYAMKVRVNEEVKGSFAWSPAEKIAWEAERVERRIAEARLLAKEGNLTDEAEATIAATVREHAENASLAIAELRTTDVESAQVAQVALESTLEVQTAILTKESESASSSTIDSLAATVEEVKQGVSAHDPVTEPTLTFERMSALLESETTRARELATSITGTVTDDEKKDVERRILDIERSVRKVNEMHGSGESDAVIALQRTILSDIQKLISFMTDIDIRSSIALETIVPIKLTPEEQLAVVSSDLEVLKNDAVEVHALGETIHNEDISAKFAQGEADLEALIVSIEMFRSEARYEDALALIADARALIADLMLMKDVEHEASPLPVPEVPTAEVEATTTAPTTTDETLSF